VTKHLEQNSWTRRAETTLGVALAVTPVTLWVAWTPSVFFVVVAVAVISAALLVLLVAAGTAVIGTGTAWLVTMCQFPGRQLWTWALLLPYAAPTYVLAYTYTDFFEVGGPFQGWIRQTFALQVGQYWFPPVRSLGGAILMLVLTLYPYVFMAGQVAFREQSQQTTEVSRSLGCSSHQSFWRVALPLARPSLAGGIALALMETLNDYGTVQFFAVDTLTTGIYRTWHGFGDRVAATQLAALTLFAIVALLVWEQGSRKRRRYYQTFATRQSIQRYRLSGGWGVLAVLICAVPTFLGFVLPAWILIYLAIADWQESVNRRFWGFAMNSLLLASVAAVVILICAVILAYGKRQSSRGVARVIVQGATTLAGLGYGIPGAVVAVGILVPLGALDQWLDGLWRTWTGQGTGLLLSGTLFALQFAYVARFLAVALTTVQSSLIKIRPQLDEASRSLGHTTLQTLWRIHLPLLGPGLLTAALLVFVDVMKELPATLIIRPFNLETLAVRAFQMASDERLAEAMAPSLAIVLVGLAPVLLLNWQLQRSR